jgi:hypothetical protein
VKVRPDRFREPKRSAGSTGPMATPIGARSVGSVAPETCGNFSALLLTTAILVVCEEEQ